MSDNSNIPQFDPSAFSNSPFVRRVEKPWGYELHLVPEELPYMFKIMHVNKGQRLSLQLHDKKQETYLIINGQAKLIWENDKGELVETNLENEKGFSTFVGQKHRICGITDCDIVEASTPESGTTWRLEDDFSRPNETPEQRKKERGEE